MDDKDYLRLAAELAERGAGWVSPNPLVGAVIVKDGRIIGQGWHARCGGLHAERAALADCREDPAGATLYVTLEPCPMCAGGIINARIGTVRYGAKDDKAGACGSVLNLFEERFNHRPRLYRGPMEAECGRALRAFFEDLREKDGFSEEI